MADISRDSFRQTNVLHARLSGEVVDDPRHYVGVRLQQGVPLVDADWNELDEIRRCELELLIRDVIGNGVPGRGSGFAIGPLEADNDFAVLPGILVVDGWQAINPVFIAYSELPRFLDDEGVSIGTDLTTPDDDRGDIVYLDLWEETILASGGADPDDRLVDPRIGIETAARLERRWTVRVAEGAASFEALELSEPGHKFYPLARLRRSGSEARIDPGDIEDLRRLGLTLADAVKAPMFVERGGEVLDAERFSLMLAELRAMLRFWQENDLFPIVIGSLQALMSYQNSMGEILQVTLSAEVSSDTGQFDNADGLTVMGRLVDVQQALLDTVRRFGSGIPSEMSILDRYEVRLDGDPDLGLAGIRPPLDEGDLLGAVEGQEALTTFLGLSTGDLPEGSVDAILERVEPGTPLEAGISFDITYRVESELLSPDTPEIFDLQAESSDARWGLVLDRTQLTLGPGESDEVMVTVTPSGTLGEGDFADIVLVAFARRRPSIRSVQTPQRFTVGELPPGFAFLFYNGKPLSDGVLELSRSEVEERFFRVRFTLVNTTGGDQSETYHLEWELVWPDVLPPNVEPESWFPNEPQSLDQEVIEESAQVNPQVRAPDLALVTEEVELSLEITATLTHVANAPIGDGPSLGVNLPIRVLLT